MNEAIRNKLDQKVIERMIDIKQVTGYGEGVALEIIKAATLIDVSCSIDNLCDNVSEGVSILVEIKNSIDEIS